MSLNRAQRRAAAKKQKPKPIYLHDFNSGPEPGEKGYKPWEPTLEDMEEIERRYGDPPPPDPDLPPANWGTPPPVREAQEHE